MVFQKSGNNVIVALAEEGKTFEELSDKVTITNWYNVNNRVETFMLSDGTVLDHSTLFDPTEGDDNLNHYGDEDDVINALGGNDTIRSGAGDDTIHGNDGNDNLGGEDGDDTLYGDAGDDTLYGGAGNDTLDGGTGTDTLDGYRGDDTYLFGRGDGQDQVIEANQYYDNGWKNGGNDTLKFKEGITVDDIVIQQSRNEWEQYGIDLVIGLKEEGKTFDELSDKITIKNGAYYYEWNSQDYTTNANYNYRVENFEFADGTQWSFADIVAHIGSDGDDAIHGFNSADTLEGGKGNDTLKGYKGDDTYIFNRGDGQDTIYDFGRSGNDYNYYNAGNDTLKFGDGITAEDVIFYMDGDNLVIDYSNGDKVTIQSQNSDNNAIEKVQLNDGTYLSNIDIQRVITNVAIYADENNIDISTPEAIRANAQIKSIYENSWRASDGSGEVQGPIVLDLNHDGITSTTLEDSTVYFDYDGDGKKEQTAWAQGDDALLAVDLNHNGLIDDGSELFGNNTVLPDGTMASDGYTALAQYDTNGDRIIDDKDSAFSKLLLWKDANQNGKSEAGELTSIQLSGVSAIYLFREDGSSFSEITENGNIITNQTIYNTLDNGDGTVRDVWFKFDKNNTITDNDTLKATASYRELSGGEGDDTYLYALGDGTVTIDDNGNGTDKIKFASGISADQLIVKWNRNSKDLVIGVMENAEDNTPLKELSDQILIKNWFDDEGLIESLEFSNGDTLDRESIYNLLVSKRDEEEITARVLDVDGELKGGDYNDVLYGTSGDELLKGYNGDDFLDGEAGDDKLVAGKGDDSLKGGKGDDTLLGEAGDDYYIYNRGDGRDIIIDSLGEDTLMFGEGIGQRDLLIEFNGDDLMIGLKDGEKSLSELSDVITIQNYTEKSFKIENIDFADGSTYNIAELVEINTNHAPTMILESDTYIMQDIRQKSGLILATDVDGDALSYTVKDAAEHGTLTLDDNGLWVYHATEGYLGEDSVTIEIDDGNGKSTTTVLQFELKATEPTIEKTTYHFKEDDTFSGVLPVAGNKTGLTYEIVQNSSNASFSIDENGQYVYTPNKNFNGLDTATIKITNNYGQSYTTTLTFEVEAVNDAPEIKDTETHFELTNTDSVEGKIDATDIDGDTLSYSITSDAGAAVTIDENGAWKYVPTSDYSGTDSVLIKVDDGHGGVVTKTFLFDVIEAIAEPNIDDLTLELKEDMQLSGVLDVTGNTDGLTYEVVTGSEHATLTIDDNGHYTYSPQANYNGTDTITVKVTNSHGKSDTAVLTFNIEAVNDAPTVESIETVTVSEDAVMVTGQVEANDVDANSVLTYSADAVAGFTLNENGSYSFDAGNEAYQHLAQGETQTVTVPVTVADEHGASVQTEISFVVTGTNDAPVVADITAVSTTEDAAVVTGNITSTDVDDNATVTYRTTANIAGFVLNSDGSYSFNPADDAYQALAEGETQKLTIAVTATDDQGATDSKDLVITVTGTNDAPTVESIETVTVAEDAAIVTGQVEANDVDANSVLTYSANAVAGFTLNENGSYSFDAGNEAYQHLAQGETQTVTVPVTVADEHGASVQTEVSFVVTGTNDAPVIADITAVSTIEDAAVVTGNITSTDADDNATVTYSTEENIAGFTLNQDGSYSFNPADDAYQALAEGETQKLTIAVTATDDQGATDSKDLVITVTGTNDAPTVAKIEESIVLKDALNATGIVNANDVDSTNLSYTIATTAEHGTVTIDENGKWNYNVDSTYAGSDSVIIAVTDDKGATVNKTLNFTIDNNPINGTGHRDYLSGTKNNDILNGLSGNDRLYAYGGDDKLFGGSGKDRLYGYTGNDELHGGTENDYLAGGYGSDSYYFNKGDGNDTIYDRSRRGSSDIDKIIFGNGITKDDVKVTKSGNDLILKIGEDDSVRVKYWFHSDNYKVETIRFSDDSALSVEEINELVTIEGSDKSDRLYGSNALDDKMYGHAGNDRLYAYGGDDKLFGGSGKDRLYGYTGNDELHGGTENDYLAGGYGSDSYYFNKGDGNDTIYDRSRRDSSDIDKIIFGDGITKEDVSFTFDKKNLLIQYSDNDQITVKYQDYHQYGYGIEKVELADGNYLTNSDIDSLVQQINAYVTENDLDIDSNNDIKQNEQLMQIIQSSWHN